MAVILLVQVVLNSPVAVILLVKVVLYNFVILEAGQHTVAVILLVQVVLYTSRRSHFLTLL